MWKTPTHRKSAQKCEKWMLQWVVLRLLKRLTSFFRVELKITQFHFGLEDIQEIMGEKLRVKGCGHYSRLNCPSGDKRNFKGRWFLCSFRFSKGLQRSASLNGSLARYFTHWLKSEKSKNFAHFLDVLCPVFDGHSRVFSFSLWLGMRSSSHHFYDINIFIIITVLGNHQNIS